MANPTLKYLKHVARMDMTNEWVDFIVVFLVLEVTCENKSYIDKLMCLITYLPLYQQGENKHLWSWCKVEKSENAWEKHVPWFDMEWEYIFFTQKLVNKYNSFT